MFFFPDVFINLKEKLKFIDRFKLSILHEEMNLEKKKKKIKEKFICTFLVPNC